MCASGRLHLSSLSVKALIEMLCLTNIVCTVKRHTITFICFTLSFCLRKAFKRDTISIGCAFAALKKNIRGQMRKGYNYVRQPAAA